MTTARRTRSQFTFCITAAVVSGALFSSGESFGDASGPAGAAAPVVAIRPVATLTAAERASLPDATRVSLRSGRAVSLGVLRAEHKARMERFAKVAPPAALRVTNPKLSLVPFQAWKDGPFIGLPKDALDFCKGAMASACIYLPPETTFVHSSTNGFDVGISEDPLITDETVCKYNGGWLNAGTCDFSYPFAYVINFLPTGPLSSTATCAAPGSYLLDPKGALKVSAGPLLDKQSFYTTGAQPVTCAAQAWIAK